MMTKTHRRLTVALGLLSVAAFAANASVKTDSQAQSLTAAVRAGNIQRVKALLNRGTNPNTKDANGMPLIMVAALYSDASMVQLLLDRGADPDAKNGDDATALILVAGDPAKARALVAKGANVNARSKQGRTPLMNAAAQDGAFESVKLLVDKGADVNAADRLPNFTTGGVGSTPLMLAARGIDSRATKYLLEHGANAKAADSAGGTALLAAARQGSVANVQLLIAAGADVNAAPKDGFFKGFTPLAWAASLDHPEMVELLIASGANVNAKDGLGYTPLTWAAMSETGNARAVRALLKAGADPNVKGAFDGTPAMFAARKGQTDIAAALGVERTARSAKAIETSASEPSDAAAVRRAIAKGISILQPTGPKFVKVSGCVSCHNNTLPVMAMRMAQDRGIPIDTANLDQQVKAIKGTISPFTEPLAQATDAAPDMQVVGAYILDSLASAGYKADAMTTAIVQNIVTKQLADGSWANFAPRAPLENGAIQATAYAVRAIQLYGPAGRKKEFEERFAHAREWLRNAEPKTTEEYIMKALGLMWTGAERAEVEAAGRAVMALQRADGGWAQLDTLDSDAYATGKALHALAEVGLKPSNTSYRRGVSYLLNTQLEDGSWLVKSRPFPFQPYKESGFPHGKDQWISAAATAWASMALSYSLDGAETRVANAR